VLDPEDREVVGVPRVGVELGHDAAHDRRAVPKGAAEKRCAGEDVHIFGGEQPAVAVI